MTKEGLGHPETTAGSGKFQQPVLRGDNLMRIDPATGLPAPAVFQPRNGGAEGSNAQIADQSSALDDNSRGE
jgi:hypothetical protein